MTLVDFFKENKFYGLDKIHVSPNISAKLISNVVGAYSIDVDPKEILILIDDTLFGSAKDGIVICKDRLVIREAFSGTKSYSYRSIDDISCENRKVFINNKQASKLIAPDKNDLSRLFELLNKWISLNEGAVNSNDNESNRAVSFSDFLYEEAGKVVSDNIYVRPDIPRKKLKAAVDAYGSGVSEESVIVLIDDTAFGGAKDGVLITDTGIRVKIFTEALRSYKWEAINSISVEKNTIYINRAASGKFVQVKGKEFVQFFRKINKFISEKEISDKTAEFKIQDQLEREFTLQEECLEIPIIQKETELIAQAVDAEYTKSEVINSEVVTFKAEDNQSLTTKDKLINAISTAIEQNKSKILPLLKNSAGELSLAALREDENIEKLARFIYTFLPGVVRFALKEDVFIRFVLDNRSKLLDKLLEDEVIQDSENISAIKSLVKDDRYENQVAELLGYDEPSQNTGVYVLSMLENVIIKLEHNGEKDFVKKAFHQFAINNLTDFVEALESIKSFSREEVEREVVSILPIMYGFGFYKVSDEIRSSECFQEFYIDMLCFTLSSYDDLTRSNLLDKDEQSGLMEILSVIQTGTKEDFNKEVQLLINKYKSEPGLGGFNLDSIMLLFRKANSFAEQLNKTLVDLNVLAETEADVDRLQRDKSPSNSGGQITAQSRNSLRVINNDSVFGVIVRLNTVGNVGGFIESMLSSNENINSKINKKFQSYIARTVTSFREEVVEKGGVSELRNDVATIEICGAVMSFAFIEMRERGVSNDVSVRVLYEGIRATFNMNTSVQNDPLGVSLIKIIETYMSGSDRAEQFMNIFVRLIGSNLNGSLRPDYLDVLQSNYHILEDFISSMESELNIFVNKIIRESSLLVDEVLGVRW